LKLVSRRVQVSKAEIDAWEIDPHMVTVQFGKSILKAMMTNAVAHLGVDAVHQNVTIKRLPLVVYGRSYGKPFIHQFSTADGSSKS